LAQKEVNESESKPSESSTGGSALTTARQLPTKPKQRAAESSIAVLQWIGERGEHLGLERFTRFDGVEWQADTTLPAAAIVGYLMVKLFQVFGWLP
jgi:hypothetical protein